MTRTSIRLPPLDAPATTAENRHHSLRPCRTAGQDGILRRVGNPPVAQGNNRCASTRWRTSVAAGGAAVETRPFPEGRKAIDIGSYYTNYSRIRDELGWEPKVGFTDGISRTLAYYSENLPHYLDPAFPRPLCTMPEHQGLRRRLKFANV